MSVSDQIIQSYMNTFYKDNQTLAETEIKKYMVKNNLMEIDLKRYGVILCYPHKKEYTYKGFIICTTNSIPDIFIKGEVP